MIGRQGAAGDVDDPSPFSPYSAYLLNLAPLVYRVFNAQSSVTTLISWLIILVLLGYIFYLIWRSQPSEESYLLDFGLVSALSLLAVYHRNYDVSLLFLPGNVSERLSAAYPALLDSYFWRVVAPFQAWVSVAILAALMWLKTHPTTLSDYLFTGS
jgi:hypothetical protein